MNNPPQRVGRVEADASVLVKRTWELPARNRSRAGRNPPLPGSSGLQANKSGTTGLTSRLLQMSGFFVFTAKVPSGRQAAMRRRSNYENV